MKRDVRDIGLIKTSGRDGERQYDVEYWTDYGVTCPGMFTTNGDPRWVADLAANRSKIVERHKREGIDYSLSVLIGDHDISDWPFEDAMKLILQEAGGRCWGDMNYQLAAARRQSSP
jgi:hypothetical protein